MKFILSIVAIFAIASSAVAQAYERIHVGPPPASLSAFFASKSSATALSTPSTPGGSPTTATTEGVVSNTATTATLAGGINTVATGTTPTTTATTTGTTSPSSSSGGNNCITFTADDPSWSYSNSAPWTGSGTFASLPGGKLCFPAASAGGAMYIGTSANPGAGNTKLECYFPPDGSQGNCDISLVDGYSLSVSCSIEGGSQPVIGGDVNLWDKGTCPGAGDQGGICKNANSYDSAQSDVAAFFQPGVQAPNNYCIWWACTQDSFFNSGSEITCHVSGGASAAASKRELIGGGGGVLERKHARSLGQVLV